MGVDRQYCHFTSKLTKKSNENIELVLHFQCCFLFLEHCLEPILKGVQTCVGKVVLYSSRSTIQWNAEIRTFRFQTVPKAERLLAPTISGSDFGFFFGLKLV